MPLSCFVVPLLATSTLFAFWLMNQQATPSLSPREQRIMLWFTVFGIAQGAIIGLVAEPITDFQMWLFNLLSFSALIPTLIAGVYWRAIVTLSEKTVETVREIINPNHQDKKTVERLVKVAETIDYYRTMEAPNMDVAIKEKYRRTRNQTPASSEFYDHKNMLGLGSVGDDFAPLPNPDPEYFPLKAFAVNRYAAKYPDKPIEQICSQVFNIPLENYREFLGKIK